MEKKWSAIRGDSAVSTQCIYWFPRQTMQRLTRSVTLISLFISQCWTHPHWKSIITMSGWDIYMPSAAFKLSRHRKTNHSHSENTESTCNWPCNTFTIGCNISTIYFPNGLASFSFCFFMFFNNKNTLILCMKTINTSLIECKRNERTAANNIIYS